MAQRSVRLELGIREHKGTIEASVDHNEKRHIKCFPIGTSLPVIRRWRTQKKNELKWSAFDRMTVQAHNFPASLDGWCYLYILRANDVVKIGRAADLRDRMKTLQVSHPTPLVLIGVAPIHGTLEPLIHQRLAQWRVRGEWYEIAGDVLRLIEMVQSGTNPVTFVWPRTNVEIAKAFAKAGDGHPDAH